MAWSGPIHAWIGFASYDDRVGFKPTPTVVVTKP